LAAATIAPVDAATIELRGVSKTFPGRRRTEVPVLREVDFTARDGEFVSVIGPSGCGKSTLFSLIAGLAEADAGTITLNGRPLNRDDHPVAYMPQKDLLLPWRSVMRNVTLPLQVSGMDKGQARAKAEALFPLFGLEGFEDAYPFTLSGGMRQRAALMRTVIQERSLMLLDEPFGALDSLTRIDMQEFLLDVWSRFRQTIVFITHDIREAIYVSDRIYVMTARPARVRMIVDVDLPRPRSPEVITTPEFTRLEAELLRTLREENQDMRDQELRETGASR
jgi:ABC-type nitrate/sulfonate/bicarbonate transport system ATPase subunit